VPKNGCGSSFFSLPNGDAFNDDKDACFGLQLLLVAWLPFGSVLWLLVAEGSVAPVSCETTDAPSISAILDRGAIMAIFLVRIVDRRSLWPLFIFRPLEAEDLGGGGGRLPSSWALTPMPMLFVFIPPIRRRFPPSPEDEEPFPSTSG
jgi:hypothetical protein